MTVWGCFIRKAGSPYYPSERPANALFDKFFCKACGKSLEIQMAGVQNIGERSFEDKAFFKLADHLADHVYYEHKPTRSYIVGKVHEKMAWKKFVREAVEVKVCPQCGSDIQMESEELSQDRGGLLIWRCKNAACDFKIKAVDL